MRLIRVEEYSLNIDGRHNFVVLGKISMASAVGLWWGERGGCRGWGGGEHEIDVS
jgi:hypothetical protein